MPEVWDKRKTEYLWDANEYKFAMIICDYNDYICLHVLDILCDNDDYMWLYVLVILYNYKPKQWFYVK